MTSRSERSSNPFTLADGQVMVRGVRETIENFLKSKIVVTPKALTNDARFDQKLGCFVTLKQNDAESSLRGCIGFAEPIYKLSHALPQAAVYAATEDPRFPPVTSSELDSLLVEISVLTKPVRIDVTDQEELPSKIRIGADGLIMKWSFGSGLLLPQVAPEFNWDAKQFLENLSMKAGAPPDQWLVPGTLVFKFQAQVFGEISPKGEVILSKK
jgi:uncharacterized protein